MPTLAEMRSSRHKPQRRTFLIATPMKLGGGYDGQTTDFLMQMANRGLESQGVIGCTRDYGGNTELSRARLSAVFMHRTPATHMLFLDADNALDLETWDALRAVDGDVVCVPYIRRMPPHVWTLRLSSDVMDAPRLRECAGERLLSLPGAGTGVMLISRDCMRRVWEACPELKSSCEGAPHMVACFNNLPSMDPMVELKDGRLVEVHPELPWWAMDDYAFCERARAAGCRVEVLVDRVASHAGVVPQSTLATNLWPNGKPAKRDAPGT